MLAAIVVGVWAMIFMTAMMRGMVEDMLVRGIENLPGHVQVHHNHYLDDPNIEYLLQEPNSEQIALLQSQIVSRWYSRINVPAVISSERESRGVTLKGIDPRKEKIDLHNNLSIVEGEFLENSDDRGIIVGERLAKKLETRLGKRVVVLSQDPSNNISEKGFRIIGVFRSELSSQEETQVFIGKATAQKFLKTPGQVSEIAIFGDDYRDVSRVLSLASKFSDLDEGGQSRAQSWMAIDTFMGSMVGLMDGFVFVWIVVIFLAMSFGLANTLVMAVFERVREIGLMLALGMRPRLIVGQILLESIFLLLLGLLVGNLIAFFTLDLLSDGIDLSQVAQGLEMMGVGTVLKPLLLTKDVWLANVIVLILGALTCLLPAIRAARLKPVEAINRAT